MTGKRKKTSGDEERLKTVLEHIGPEFIEESAKQIGAEDLDSVLECLDEVEEHFEKKTALARFREDGKLLVELLQDYRDGSYTAISYWSVSLIAFALGYILKPIDIIPDSLPVIGQLDDAVVLSHCLVMLKKDLHAYRVWSMARDAKLP